MSALLAPKFWTVVMMPLLYFTPPDLSVIKNRAVVTVQLVVGPGRVPSSGVLFLIDFGINRHVGATSRHVCAPEDLNAAGSSVVVTGIGTWKTGAINVGP